MELADKYDFFEVQAHNHPDQIAFNKRLYDLSKRLGKPLIAGTDTHSSSKYKAECRQALLEAKNKSYGDEDSFDLSFKTYDELVQMFKEQKALPEDAFMQAIDNTNLLYALVDDIELDTKIKYPILYGTREKDADVFVEKERHPNDYYATDPKAMELLLEKEQFSKNIWECACGSGHLSKVLEQHGYNVRSTDLVYRGYGEIEPLDFLNTKDAFDGDIVTNPPYKYALEFVRKSLDIVKHGNKVAMFLKLQFLESKSRKELFLSSPPKTVYVCSSRLDCAINGEFENHKASAMAYLR